VHLISTGMSEYQMWRDAAADSPVLVCQIGGSTASLSRAVHSGPASDAENGLAAIF
jgi:hypothetical protein